MMKVTALALLLATAVFCQGYDDEHYNYNDGHNYEFGYSVNDPYHYDIKSQKETKIGDLVKGYYSLEDTDGTRREVVYAADKKGGFNAVVTKNGEQVFPEIITPAQYAIPLYPRHY